VRRCGGSIAVTIGDKVSSVVARDPIECLGDTLRLSFASPTAEPTTIALSVDGRRHTVARGWRSTR
jgi:hypothetical protein